MSRFRDCRYEATCRDYALNHCDGCNEWEWVFNKPTQPTADVVEVVRCKDCVYWRKDINHCLDKDRHANADDYCAWGERKDEVEEDG